MITGRILNRDEKRKNLQLIRYKVENINDRKKTYYKVKNKFRWNEVN